MAATTALAMAVPARAQAQAPSAADLAKKLANPIFDLVSIPFQFNWQAGTCG
jgi:hypothetical protein